MRTRDEDHSSFLAIILVKILKKKEGKWECQSCKQRFENYHIHECNSKMVKCKYCGFQYNSTKIVRKC